MRSEAWGVHLCTKKKVHFINKYDIVHKINIITFV